MKNEANVHGVDHSQRIGHHVECITRRDDLGHRQSDHTAADAQVDAANGGQHARDRRADDANHIKRRLVSYILYYNNTCLSTHSNGDVHGPGLGLDLLPDLAERDGVRVVRDLISRRRRRRRELEVVRVQRRELSIGRAACDAHRARNSKRLLPSLAISTTKSPTSRRCRCRPDRRSGPSHRARIRSLDWP